MPKRHWVSIAPVAAEKPRPGCCEVTDSWLSPPAPLRQEVSASACAAGSALGFLQAASGGKLSGGRHAGAPGPRGVCGPASPVFGSSTFLCWRGHCCITPDHLSIGTLRVPSPPPPPAPMSLPRSPAAGQRSWKDLLQHQVAEPL